MVKMEQQPRLDMLPQDREAEQAILGAVILHNQVFQSARAALPKEAFFSTIHQRIFSAMCAVSDADKPIDEVTVFTELKSVGSADMVGGYGYLGELTRLTPVVDNIDHYISSVVNTWQLRSLMVFYERQRQRIGTLTSDQAVGEITTFLDQLKHGGEKSLSMNSNQVWLDFTEELDARATGKSTAWYQTGLPSIDSLIGGLQPTAVYVIAARPAMGKSAFALNLALRMCKMMPNSALPDPVTTLFMSLEMSNHETAGRMAAMLGGVDHDKIQEPHKLTGMDWDDLTQASAKVMNCPHLHISDIGGLSIEKVIAEVNKIHAVAEKSTSGRMVLFIDYLQLLGVEDSGKKQDHQVLADISKALKQLAMKLKIVIVELAQLNRNLENRNEKRPMLSDLRGSGTIEQDANVVMGLFREGVYDDNADECASEVIVLKNRNGKSGTANLYFDGAKQRFTEFR